MAKISAKHSYHSELIKLRRTLDAYREELASLDTKYDDKIENQLNAFINKGNNKLKKLAFQACDKEQYAQAVLDEKLQKYDVKSYMKQREINHGATKSIFKLVKDNIVTIFKRRQNFSFIIGCTIAYNVNRGLNSLLLSIVQKSCHNGAVFFIVFIKAIKQ